MKYLVFAFFIFCVGCRTEETTNKVEPSAIQEQADRPSGQSSDEIRQSTLTTANWNVEIVLDNGKINEKNDWKGSELSFKSDGSYEWKGEAIANKGEFSLDTDKNMIILQASSPELSSEWSIKHKKNVMVWIGTPKFGHHSLQMKLVSQK